MRTELYPEIEIYKEHMIPVSLAYDLCGRVREPIRSSSRCVTRWTRRASSPANRQFFDPEFYRIIQFDQRGCGKKYAVCVTRRKIRRMI